MNYEAVQPVSPPHTPSLHRGGTVWRIRHITTSMHTPCCVWRARGACFKRHQGHAICPARANGHAHKRLQHISR